MKLSQEAAGVLVAAVGNDLRALTSAIAQLADDADGAPVDEALVQKYFAGRAEVTSFAVSDAVLAGNTSLALERLRWALGTGVAPVLITSPWPGHSVEWANTWKRGEVVLILPGVSVYRRSS